MSTPNSIDALAQMQLNVAADDRRVRRIGLLLVSVALGAFGLWACLAPINGAALAPAVVTVEGYRKTVQHLEGGIVRELKVSDGDLVSKDQVLLVLDDTQSRAQLEVLRGQYFIALAREARLIAQRDQKARVTMHPDPLADESDPRMRDALRVQNQTFQARRAAQDGEEAVYRRRIDELHEKIVGLRAQMSSRRRLAQSYRDELQDFNALLKDGFVEKQKVRDLERNLAQSEGQVGELESEIAAAGLEVGETELKILQLDKDLQREIAKELSEVQSDLFQMREKVQSLQDTVTRTVLMAPESGMVLGLSIHTVGGVIAQGAHILDIVPQNEKLILEARVSPADVDRVHVGQTAELRLTSFNQRKTPRVNGKVVSLSADRLFDERNAQNPPYYLARVEVSPEGITALRDLDLTLVPGMPAEVLINTGERTLVQYLLRPLTDTFARSFIED